MSAPLTFLVKAYDFSRFKPISERAPARFPDSSPALVMDTKSLEKTLGNLARADERVPPELISSSIEIRTLRRVTFFVCFCKTERALDKESPALIMPLKFFVRMISSAVLTRSRRCSKKATTLNGLVFFAEIDTGIFPRDRSSRPREKRSRESISPSTIDPSFDFAL